MRILLIDNYDSYTFNLFHLIASIDGAEPMVARNDAITWEEIRSLDLDAVVISPGPGHPARTRDLGICADIIRHSDIPVLGVCLGHQALAWLCGSDVRPAPRARHGHLSLIRHDGTGLFEGIMQNFVAVRYHSLCVPAETLSSELAVTAWAEDDVVMGLRHKTRPLWGVQFHPESVATEHGRQLLANFRRLALADRASLVRERRTAPGRAGQGMAINGTAKKAVTGSRWRVIQRTIDREMDAAGAFRLLFGDHPFAFWLDSSRVEAGLSRFSFLGAPEGPDGEVLSYDLNSGIVTVRPSSGPSRHLRASIFDVLRDRLNARAMPAQPQPFEFACGYVGYFGYELKAELEATNSHVATTPDALWMAATRMVAIDHADMRTYLLALCRTDDQDDVAAAQSWLDSAQTRLARVRGQQDYRLAQPATADIDPEPRLRRPRCRYVADIIECQRQLNAGESYEICLTNAAVLPLPGDPLTLYLRQRKSNPAPYAAFLRFDDLAVLCSSPERFLRIDRHHAVESKPIKGTAPRHEDPVKDDILRRELATSAKTRAENLMIVDLIRNDLGRVCEIGTVEVTKFMAVESYTTVHQLVSTIRGQLRDDVDVIDCVRACFPGGSMTGAPKLRTMEIIDRLETGPRGIYSGTLGFLGLCGTADLNIVIRTAVAQDDCLTVGAGGAIVLDSDPEDEYEEMLLKARATLRGQRVPAGSRRYHQAHHRAARRDNGSLEEMP